MLRGKPQLLAIIALGFLTLGCLRAAPASGQDRSQGRSMVISRGGIVAAESPLAAQAGATVLAHGGNAIDAIVATNAVMGVVEPMMNGMGGDLFAIVYIAKTGKLYGLNASGWAPAKLTIGFLKAKGVTQMPEFGIDTVTVPGVVDGWSKLLSRFGTRKLSDVLAPAIAYARDGFPVAEWDAEYWDAAAATLHADPNLSQTYLIDGHTPGVGEVFRNPDLARSLELVARGGRDAFYKGPIAGKIVDLSRQLGGAMTAADLADYSSEWVQPIATTYHGWTVSELPPNGQGIAALMMLNMMERFPLTRYGYHSADALHVMIEAKKLAYADLLRYVGDPRFSQVPVAAMLSQQLCRGAGCSDQHDAGELQCGGRQADARHRGRYHLPDRCRQSGQHGVADPEQLPGVRLTPGGEPCGVRAAGSWGALQPRSCLAGRTRRAQTPAAHDHSGVHAERR